jgi:hypothetical protein
LQLPDAISQKPARRDATRLAPMRAMFVIWLAVIVVGLILFSVIGLTHN